MLTACSSVEIDKYLWDINGSPNTHVDIQAGDELIYSFEVTNTGCDKLSDVAVSDPLPGLVMQSEVAVPYTAYAQSPTIAADGVLGPFASVDRELVSDPFEAKAWDNFSLSSATVIDGIKWTGAYVEPFAHGAGVLTPETDFTVEIFSDAGGVPGAVQHSFDLLGGDAGVSDANVTSSLLGHTAKDGGPVYEYAAMLPFTVLTSGDYWISITAKQTFPNDAPTVDPTWQWHLGSNPDADGFYFFDDTFDTAGDNDAGEVDEAPRPANKQAGKDLAFELNAARLEDFNGMLLPGESVMFMGTYIVTDADVAAGEVVNTATVTGSNPDGGPVSDSDTEVVSIDLNSIDVDKYLWDINGLPDLHSDIKAGDELIYAFEVTNDGRAKLDNVKLTDPLPGLVMDPDVLEPYVAFEQAVSIPPDGNLGPFASIDSTLASDPFEAKAWDNFSVSGTTVIDAIHWTGAYVEPFATGAGVATPETDFLVEIFSDNAGKPGALHTSFNLDGGDAGVSDANVTSTLMSHTTADGGAVFGYEAMLPFTVLSSGDYWISITAQQTFPNAAPTVDPTWQWHLGSGSGDGFYTYDDTFDDAGDNDQGDVDGTPSPTIFEDGKDLAFTLHAARRITFDGCLHPGETVVFMGTYIVTDADVVAGQVVNTATAMGDGTSGPVSDSDTEVVKIDNGGASIDVDKYLWDINGLPDLHTDLMAGDELIYAFEVTNDGSHKLDNVKVTDPLTGLVMDPDVLEPYVAFDQATSIPADGNLGPFASVDSTKASDPFEAKAWDNFSLSGTTVLDGIHWTGAYVEPFATGAGVLTPETDFLVEIFNDNAGTPGALHTSFSLDGGDAGVSDGNVSSTLLSHSAADGGPAFAYEAMLPFTVLSSGDYWISITAQQTFPNASPTVDPTWQWHLGSGSGDGFYTYDDTFDDAGDNDQGDVDGTATPAVFEDGKDLAFTLHAARRISFDGCLYPGETVVFMGTYVITDADVAAGEVVNTATAMGDGPGGAVMDSDTEVVIIDPQSSIDIDKYLWDINGSPDLTQDIVAGDELIYSFDVTNTGSTKLSNVMVMDSLPGVVIDHEVLEPYSAYAQEYVVPADNNLGPFASVDSTLASDPQEAKAWDNFSLADTTVIDMVSWVGAYVEPFATGAGVHTPETDFVIEIFSDSAGKPGALHTSFSLEGGLAGVDDGNVATSLIGGHTAEAGGPVYSYNAMLPFTVLTAGDYWISITAHQTFPNDAPTVDPTWQWHLGKNASGGDGFYSFDDTFDNPGDLDLGLVDAEPEPLVFQSDKDLAFELHASRKIDFNGMLLPGETVMFMGTYIVTPDDVAAGEIINTGTAKGEKPHGGQVTDSDTVITQVTNSIHIDKFLWDVNGSPSLTHELQVGDELIYSFNVTNTGSQKLSDVKVTDSLPDLVMDEQVAETYVAFDQPTYIAPSGDLGVYASVDRDLADDPYEAKAWDNFSLADGTVIDALTFRGAYDEAFVPGSGQEVDFLIEIFKDDAGKPGEEAFSFTANGGRADIGGEDVYVGGMSHMSPGGGMTFHYEAMLPFTYLAAGDYWMSITAEQTFPSADPVIDPTWQWHLGSGSGDGFYAYDETFDTEPQFVAGKDLQFTIHASELVDFDGMLDPHESVMFMGTYVVTQDDINAGEILNTGTAMGTLPSGAVVSDSDDFDWKITTPGSADLNGNGVVDFADFLILSAHFGHPGEYAQGDIDHDGQVAFSDFLLLSGQFGDTVEAAFADGDDWLA